MEWYWWLLIMIVVCFLIVRSAIKGSQKPVSNELAFLDRDRCERADANRELEKVVDVIAALPVIGSQSSPGNTLSRSELAGSVRNFLEPKLLTEWRTQTKMVHIVVSPRLITAFAKLHPTRPQTAIREFMRIEDNTWSFRTRQVDNMQVAIRQADQEAHETNSKDEERRTL
jgi:hypothetical protein